MARGARPRHARDRGRDRGRRALRGDRGRGPPAGTRSARRCPRACPPRSSSRGRTRCASSSRATPARTARSTRPTRRAGSGSPRRPWSRRSPSSARDGRVLQGEFRPGGRGLEWTGADVLGTLRRLSLAAQRREVEPVEPEALARLLVDWHGVGADAARRGPDALLDVVERLQGLALPASILERDVLRARLRGYRPEDLDTLAGRGRGGLGGPGPPRRAGRPPRAVPGRRRCRTCCRRGPSRRRASCTTASAGTSPRRARPSSARSTPPPGAGSPSPSSRRSGTWPGPARSRATRPRRCAPSSPRARRAPSGASASRASARGARSRPPRSAAGACWRSPRAGPSPTERLKALAEQLLRRHGVLTRDAVAFEAVPGGFPAVYPVLRTLEEAGRIRRGYFVDGPGRPAVRRSRSARAAARAARRGSRRAPGGGARRGRSRRTRTARRCRGRSSRSQSADGEEAAARRSPRARGRAAPGPGGRTDRGDREPARAPGRAAPAAGRAGAHPRRDRRGARPRGLVRGELAARARLGDRARPALADGPLAPFLAAAGFVRSGPGFRLARRRQTLTKETTRDAPARGRVRSGAASAPLLVAQRPRPARSRRSLAPSTSSSSAATRAASARKPSPLSARGASAIWPGSWPASSRRRGPPSAVPTARTFSSSFRSKRP